MDEILIQRTNELVRPGDRIYHLGDMAWSTFDWNIYLKRINTKELHFIWGNHDKRDAEKKYPSIRSWADIRNLSLDGHKIRLCHYAMRSWESRNHGSIHLFGHSHGKLPGVGRSMDIGVDCNSYYPFAWEDIRDRMKDIPISDDPKYLPEGGEV